MIRTRVARALIGIAERLDGDPHIGQPHEHTVIHAPQVGDLEHLMRVVERQRAENPQWFLQ